jgi:hypothetical protein
MEEWDLPRVAAWNAYCAESPPLRVMVQAYLGISPASAKTGVEADRQAEELLATLQIFPGAVPRPKQAP